MRSQKNSELNVNRTIKNQFNLMKLMIIKITLVFFIIWVVNTLLNYISLTNEKIDTS